MHDPATQYATDVVSGKFVAGQLVRLACERHLNDIETAESRGYFWRPEMAQMLFDFFSLLRHSSDQWDGLEFKLEPWQAFFAGSVWGWRRADGTRRFRHAHLEIARKNGKTTLAAGIGLALEVIDGVPGAQVWTVATKLDQARLTHEESKKMVIKSPTLNKRLTIYKDSIIYAAAGSNYRPMGKESKTQDGLNMSGIIIDELHAWRDRLLWDVVTTASRSRAQPLWMRTTTAGFDKQTLWWDLRSTAVDVLEGKRNDDRLFALIYTIDDDDDWKDPACWVKANPNLGVNIKLDDMTVECKEAVDTPSEQNKFRRLCLNQVTEAFSSWIPIEFFDACAGEITDEMLVGRACYTGIDMSSARDLTAIVHVFPPLEAGGKWIMKSTFFLPEEDIDQKADQDGQPYRRWAEQGWMQLIPGRVIRPSFVEEQIERENEQHPISMLVFDRKLSVELSDNMQNKGYACVGFGQGFLSMKNPTVEFERKSVGGQFLHSGSPVLRSCVQNVVIEQDASGSQKPTKKKSTGRIDGVVAAIMALGVAMDSTATGQPEIHLL